MALPKNFRIHYRISTGAPDTFKIKDDYVPTCDMAIDLGLKGLVSSFIDEPSYTVVYIAVYEVLPEGERKIFERWHTDKNNTTWR